ncbi:MAG: radical SAM protein [Elusimicrobia bacterium]|nr:radical SAM protein [Elusimicrobiota bacterium]
MKVLFLEPLHQYWEFFRGVTASPSLIYLAAVARKEFETKVFDAAVAPDKPWDRTAETLDNERPDVVAITGSVTAFWQDTVNAAKIARKVLPGAKIVTGGYMGSYMWKDALESGLFDYIVTGEGEVTLMELLRAVEKKERDLSGIKGLAWLKDGEAVKNAPRPMIKDLDELPMPAFDLFPMERYGLAPFGGKVGFTVNFARGCVGHCRFCSEAIHWQHSWRGHGAKYMVDVLELLSKKYGKKVFYVGDNDFLHDQDRTREFIKLMRARKLGVLMWIQTTCFNVIRNESLMKDLNEIGVYQIMLGIETSKPSELQRLQKPQTLEVINKAIKIAQKHNFIIMGMLMWGSPWDTKEDLHNTLDFLIENCDIVGPDFTTPLPGTPYYDECKKMGAIEVTDFSQFNWLNAITRTADMSVGEADKYYKKWIGKALIVNRKFLGNYFFSKKPLHRTYLNMFIKMGWSFITNKPWRQKNYQPFEKFDLDKFVRSRGIKAGS